MLSPDLRALIAPFLERRALAAVWRVSPACRAEAVRRLLRRAEELDAPVRLPDPGMRLIMVDISRKRARMVELA